MILEAILGERRSTGLHPRDPALADLFRLANSRTGAYVTPDSAMTISAVYCAVRILAESVAQLPLILYRRLANGGKERATDHPLYPLLHDRPNDEQTSFEFREMLQGHLALRGNAYAQIEWTNGGRVARVVPLHPDRVRVERRAGALAYTHTPASGGTIVIPRERILHLRGLSSDGVLGVSPITLARESLGIVLATEEHGAKVWSNGARVLGILEYPGKLKPEARENLKKSFHDEYGGAANAGKTAILEEGMKWHQVGMSNEDAQFLGTRQFQTVEIARWFNLPPHMLKDLTRSTNNNIEHQSLELVMYCLMPWFRRWEQAIERDCLTDTERNVYFVEFLVDGLLRGDSQSRSEGYQKAIMAGWMSRNEARRLENLNPVEGLDEYLVPLNMIPASQLGELAPEPMGRALPVPSETRTLAGREERSLTARRRLKRAYERLFRDAAQRIVGREVSSVRAAVKRIVGARDAGQFAQWLEEFYRDHQAYVSRSMLPVLLAYAEGVHAEAAEEVNSDTAWSSPLEEFMRAYATTMATRHVLSSKGQLQQIARQAAAEELVVQLEERLDEWMEKRADKIAARESTQAGAAMAKRTYGDAGVRKLRWSGGDCALCSRMNGKVVGIDEPFLGEGETVEAEGAEPLTARRAISHPPLHGSSCDCMLLPG